MNKYEEIISSCSNLIYGIINNYFKGYSTEDLYQVGVIGLMKAYDKYQKDKSVKFSTYAYKWIYGEIYSYINTSRPVKISSESIRLYQKIIKARNRLCQILMREPTNMEIALATDMHPIDVEAILNATENIDSLDRIINDDGKDISLIDTISDKRDYDKMDYLYLKEEIKNLSPDEKKLIYLRYFKDMTQTEVSKLLGTHQVDISRTEKKVLKRIRNNYQNVA